MPILKPDLVFGRIRYRTTKLDGPVPDDLMRQAIWASTDKRGLKGVFIFKDVRKLLLKYKRTAVQETLRSFVKRGLIDDFTEGSYEIGWLER